MVAAAKLRRATQMAQAGRRMRPAWPRSFPPAARVTPGRRAAAAQRHRQGRGSPDLVVTGDRGLAGAFNTNIVRNVRRKAAALEAAGKTVLFYLVGRKGRPVLQRLYPKAIIAQYDTSQMRVPSYADAQAIAKDIVDRYTSDGIDVVHLAYALFKSTLVQEPTIDQVIPIATGKDQAGEKVPSGAATAAVEYEPDEEEILAELLPRNIAVQLYRRCGEHAGFRQPDDGVDNATRNAAT